jgi:flagellar biosynthesis/type III secretory pathway chaperone
MDDATEDKAVLKHVQRLVDEEHRLFEKASLDDSEIERLAAVQVDLDQCWDLLRQRRALREMGRDPSEAHVRPAEVVKKYIG